MTDTTSALGGAPNAIVAENATTSVVIPMNEAALLGVAGPEDAMRAIIRMANGAIISAGLGERIELGRLVDVSPGGLVLKRDSGRLVFLKAPWTAQEPRG